MKGAYKMFETEDVMKLLEVMKSLMDLVDKLYLMLAQHVAVDDLENAGINADISRAAAFAKKCGVEIGGGSNDE